MNLPRFTENVNIHQSLPDQPTLTPTELKIKWDEGVSKIKEFLNDILLPALENDISEEFSTQRTSIINEVQGLINTLDTSVKNLSNSLNTTNSNVSALQKSLNENVSSINSKITSINNSISSINTKLNTVANATSATVTMGSGMSRTFEQTYKQGNVVHSRVEMNTGIGGNQTVTLFTLPSGYRPSGNRKATVLWANGDFDGRYNAIIYTSGAVQITVGQVPPTSIVADVNFII